MVEKADSFQHDLRTHLSAIISLTDLVKNTNDPTLSAGLLDAVLIAAGSAMAMLDGETAIASEAANANSKTSHILEDFSKLATSLCKAKGVDFQLALDQTVTAARCAIEEPAHLHRALILLLDNALKYAKGSSISLQAQCGDEKTLNLVFCDDGEGFGSSDPELLFEPYHRGKSKGQVSGSGLGLWSVRNLIRATGGDILAEANEPHGARFRIWLPIIEFGSDQSPRTEEPEDDAPQEARASTAKILVVDDNKTNHLILDQILKALNTSPMHAASGREALAMLQTKRPDLALIDIRMADMDGWALAREIRATETLAELPLIAISADASPDEIAPFDNWLQRPIEPARLYGLLTAMAGLQSS
ncbi:hybrid sensor histidine kinase/response regulator [uncultured Cohaesibacter sp.]|uniref:ATP-binding response regulator n=1 Tax=uncultured Cohaesibacter sp. TaxID=1002546 RepID=UPI0029C625FA|nr:hybrid sensor histidine kinase/response regulator [uncultured Cohaesibacter sp.]